MKVQIRLLQATTEQITTHDRVPMLYEVVRNSDSGQFKVGDGITPVRRLPYVNVLPEWLVVNKI